MTRSNICIIGYLPTKLLFEDKKRLVLVDKHFFPFAAPFITKHVCCVVSLKLITIFVNQPIKYIGIVTEFLCNFCLCSVRHDFNTI